MVHAEKKRIVSRTLWCCARSKSGSMVPTGRKRVLPGDGRRAGTMQAAVRLLLVCGAAGAWAAGLTAQAQDAAPSAADTRTFTLASHFVKGQTVRYRTENSTTI